MDFLFVCQQNFTPFPDPFPSAGVTDVTVTKYLGRRPVVLVGHDPGTEERVGRRVEVSGRLDWYHSETRRSIRYNHRESGGVRGGRTRGTVELHSSTPFPVMDLPDLWEPTLQASRDECV